MTIIADNTDTCDPRLLREPRPAEENRIWAAAHLADLPTIIRFKAREIEEWTDDDGNRWRQAFTITFAPTVTRRFRINLFDGASERDLKEAERRIEGAKSGVFALWVKLPLPGSGDPYWLFDLGVRRRESEHSYTDTLRPCDAAGCIEQYHPWRDEQLDACMLEPIVHEGDHYYRVGASRWHGEPWTPWCDISDVGTLEGAGVVRALRDLANDYARMEAECERLNAPRKAAA